MTTAAYEQVHRAWKEADQKVRAAEERLGAAWAAFSTGQGGPPGAELMAEVSRLRGECDHRLSAVLDHFSARQSDRTGPDSRPPGE